MKFAGFATAADLFFRFVYDCLIDVNCCSMGFAVLNGCYIDMHRFLQMFVDFHFFYVFKASENYTCTYIHIYIY